ncbi:MAG TPA: hypothetical protein VMM93_00270, partial [Vicinamibacterales bacterium]|nr:hypothetical protein [Vicinamibacterales bacterium]
MNDHLPDLDARLRALDAAMADVVARLGRLEAQSADASPSADRGPAPVSPPVERSSGSFDMLALVGRTLIVLGGAYL